MNQADAPSLRACTYRDIRTQICENLPNPRRPLPRRPTYQASTRNGRLPHATGPDRDDVPQGHAIVEHEADDATIGHYAQLVRGHSEIRTRGAKLAPHRQKMANAPERKRRGRQGQGGAASSTSCSLSWVTAHVPISNLPLWKPHDCAVHSRMRPDRCAAESLGASSGRLRSNPVALMPFSRRYGPIRAPCSSSAEQ